MRVSFALVMRQTGTYFCQSGILTNGIGMSSFGSCGTGLVEIGSFGKKSPVVAMVDDSVESSTKRLSRAAKGWAGSFGERTIVVGIAVASMWGEFIFIIGATMADSSQQGGQFLGVSAIF
jgi:hypothetical protein